MDLNDVHGIFELLQDAGEKFPDAWRVFFSEWGESVEARREAFAALVGFVNSHFDRHTLSFRAQTPIQRQNFICAGFLSFLPAEHCYQSRVDRYLRDLVPVDEELVEGELPPFDSAALLGSIPAPSPKPTGDALLRAENVVEVRSDVPDPWGYEIIVNRCDDESWEFLAAVRHSPYQDSTALHLLDDDPDAAIRPEKWSYRLRYVELPAPGGSDCKPFGMWSDPIPVTPPI